MLAVSGKKNTVAKTALTSVAVAWMVFSLAACGNKNKSSEPGQSLVRVNGQDITVHQLNEELGRSNVAPEQKDAASKQLLESLIDRQLLEGAAMIDKIDRDPFVVQAVERAKAQIVAQAYMQRRLAKVAHPSKEDIDKYYVDHPDLFAARRVYSIDQLAIASKDFSADVKALISSGKSMDDVAVWLKERKIDFVRHAAVGNSAELPEGLVKQFKSMKKGQLFAIQGGPTTTIAAVKDTKEDPVLAAAADPQIAQFLFNLRNKEASDVEIARLRAAAKIEYLNKQVSGQTAGQATKQPTETGALTPANVAKPAEKTDGHKNDDHIKRGVADL